jgi:hypothetical protein
MIAKSKRIILVSRFSLAPKVPKLRFLPLDDETAAYLCRWIIAIAVAGSFGFLTCGIFRPSTCCWQVFDPAHRVSKSFS